MIMDNNTMVLFAGFWLVIILLIIWEGVWKAIAMWKAARNNHLAWYVCILIFNTIGILPIIYILTHKNKTETKVEINKEVKKVSKKK
jgi:hypothetical protein